MNRDEIGAIAAALQDHGEITTNYYPLDSWSNELSDEKILLIFLEAAIASKESAVRLAQRIKKALDDVDSRSVPAL